MCVYLLVCVCVPAGVCEWDGVELLCGQQVSTASAAGQRHRHDADDGLPVLCRLHTHTHRGQESNKQKTDYIEQKGVEDRRREMRGEKKRGEEGEERRRGGRAERGERGGGERRGEEEKGVKVRGEKSRR